MDHKPGIGLTYQEATKYRRGAMDRLSTWTREVPTYKTYDRPLMTIALPAPLLEGGLPLWEAIAKRRSMRRFATEPLPLATLSQLLWATQGITGKLGCHEVRACASAGALYPNETYLFVNRVADVPPGLYHYGVQAHMLEQLAEGEFAESLSHACLGQECCLTAPMVFAWGTVVARCAWKYADRAYRYLYLDAGHIGAQLQLACCGLGLGSVNIGAFFDEEVNDLLGLDGQEETAVYLTAVGAPVE